MVQLRDASQERDRGMYRMLAERLRETIQRPVLFMVNGDSDIASTVAADGVHLPERAEVDTAALSQQGLLVGKSAHSVESATRAAAEQKVHYIQVGTMFPTLTHPGKVPEGVALMAAVRASVHPNVSLVGVGGIDVHSARDVIRAGAQAVAVIRRISDARDPVDAARKLLDAMQEPD
eukprot:jgi/Chlat1/8552/Chrsp82S00653